MGSSPPRPTATETYLADLNDASHVNGNSKWIAQVGLFDVQ